jgi:hypothetical protein
VKIDLSKTFVTSFVEKTLSQRNAP